jgi:hypothetical protein
MYIYIFGWFSETSQGAETIEASETFRRLG